MAAVLDFSTPHLLRTAAEYEAAVAEIDALLDADVCAGTPEYERLQFLSVLVEAFERDHVPELPSSPQAVVAFMLEQQGRDRAELAKLMGGRSRVSEFFAGVRPLSLAQVRALREHLGIPADLLIA